MTPGAIFIFIVAMISSAGNADVIATGDLAVANTRASTGPLYLHVQEMHGFAIVIEAALIAADGTVIRRDRRYVDASATGTWELPSGIAEVRLHAVNGSGKINAAIRTPAGPSPFLREGPPRHRIPPVEIASYAAVAAAIAALAILRFRS